MECTLPSLSGVAAHSKVGLCWLQMKLHSACCARYNTWSWLPSRKFKESWDWNKESEKLRKRWVFSRQISPRSLHLPTQVPEMPLLQLTVFLHKRNKQLILLPEWCLENKVWCLVFFWHLFCFSNKQDPCVVSFYLKKLLSLCEAENQVGWGLGAVGATRALQVQERDHQTWLNTSPHTCSCRPAVYFPMVLCLCSRQISTEVQITALTSSLWLFCVLFIFCSFNPLPSVLLFSAEPNSMCSTYEKSSCVDKRNSTPCAQVLAGP